MDAKKCDRCEKFYEPYQPDAALKFSNMLIFAEEMTDNFIIGYRECRQFELCPQCMTDAVEFMQAKLPEIKK